VDLIKGMLLVGYGTMVFVVGQATLKAASIKVVKHEKSYPNNRYAFI